MIITETLTSDQLNTLLSKPSALLYPSLAWLPDSIQLDGNRYVSDNTDSQYLMVEQLIVIDATWKKSKKILHLNPSLQKIPRVNLGDSLESNYSIRKTSISNGLSTIESITKAMLILENNRDFLQLLKPFEKMVALQQLNYRKKTKAAIRI